MILSEFYQEFFNMSLHCKNSLMSVLQATTRYFYALKIYGAILLQNKQILWRNFTIKQHWTIFSRETLSDWQRATNKKRKIKKWLKIF
jgi:hypothetical protein